MTSWNKISVNSSLIKHETDKAVLIRMPKKSAYSGYAFWHPAKLCDLSGKGSYMLSFRFSDEWSFNLKRCDLKKSDPIQDKTLGAAEMIAAIGDSVAAKEYKKDERAYSVANDPADITPEVPEVLNDLRN